MNIKNRNSISCRSSIIRELAYSCNDHIDFKEISNLNARCRQDGNLIIAISQRYNFYRRNAKYIYTKYLYRKIFVGYLSTKIHDFCDMMLNDNDKNLSTRYRDRVRKLSEI